MVDSLKTQYTIGERLYDHKGATINSIVGSQTADTFIEALSKLESYMTVRIPTGYEHRPDLISELFYNTPIYWWLILLHNNIPDPFQGLNVGDIIQIPKL